MPRGWIAAALVVASSAVAPAAATAAPHPGGSSGWGSRAAEPDTSVEAFLRGFADSTDAYFGLTAAPVDTTGLDSARAYAFANPLVENLRGTLRPSLSPAFDFNRVDGPVYGGEIGAGRDTRTGRLTVHAGWAAGPNDLLGGAKYVKRFGGEEAGWTFRARGSRATANLNRQRGDSYLATMNAFVAGGDRNHYLRREGFGFSLERRAATYRVSAGWRGDREIPLLTTATWNLLGKDPEVAGNLAAARGRAREFEFDGLWRVPGTPLLAQAVHQTSSRSAGSDFEYRRTYLAAGAEVPVGRWLSLVPQLAYGRLNGEALPQQSFYLGGSRTLRSIDGQSLGGTGMMLGRLDLIAVPDLLALVGIPHPAMFPIQGSAFLASGAVWGADPYGGPTRPGLDGPNLEEWKSEAGVAFHWQPGVPDPLSYFRFSYAIGLGTNRERGFTVAYTRPLDLLRGFGD